METRPKLDIQEPSSEDDAPKDRKCCAIARPFRPLLYLAPISFATIQAINTGSALQKIFPLSVHITAALAEFFSTIGLTGEATKETFDEICESLKRGKLPKEWPELSRNKEALAILLCSIPALFAPLSESIQAYYCINSLPESYKFDNYVNPVLWAGVSGCAATFAAMTVALTDSAGMYIVVRERLASKKVEEKTIRFSDVASLTLGGVLGGLDAIQTSMEGYGALQTIFGNMDLSKKIPIGILSIANAIPFFCFSGMYSIDALKAFFSEEKPFKPKKIIAMTLSTYIGLYLAWDKILPNKAFYKSTVAGLGVDPNDVPWQVYEAFAWAIFAQNIIQITATLYSPMYNLLDRIANKTRQGCGYIRDKCCPVDETDAPYDIQPLLDDLPNETIIELEPEPIKVSTSIHTLFAQKNKSDEPESAKCCLKIDRCVLF